MPTLAAYPKMLERDRRRNGLRVCRAAWLLGVTVREYREIEAGDEIPDTATSNECATVRLAVISVAIECTPVCARRNAGVGL